MDPWQASIEGRLGRVEDRVNDVGEKVAALTAKVDALPTKDWIGQHLRNWIGGAVGVLTVVGFVLKFIHVG